MISDQDKEIVIKWAKHFSVKEVYLFGSALDDADPRDIDIAVKGIADDVFFMFYGKLLRNLTKSVDVVDLSEPSPLTRYIGKRAVKIYERPD